MYTDTCTGGERGEEITRFKKTLKTGGSWALIIEECKNTPYRFTKQWKLWGQNPTEMLTQKKKSYAESRLLLIDRLTAYMYICVYVY